MAKELGLKPHSLIKNIPSQNQQWKLPVKQWIQQLYEKKIGKTPVRKKVKRGQIYFYKNKSVPFFLNYYSSSESLSHREPHVSTCQNTPGAVLAVTSVGVRS